MTTTTRAMRSIVLVIAVAASVALLGCTTSTSDGGGSGTTTGVARAGTITVSAAASLTDPFKKIGDDFTKANPGVEVRFTFDSSSTLAKQIQDGAPADVFASADEANMNKLTDASLISGTPKTFAKNKLAIVVKTGNPAGIKTLADLAKAGVISLCGADVPCGTYADRMLTKANVTIPTDKVTRGQNAKAAFTAVAEGDAVAGIVYATDITGDKAEAVAIDDADNVIAAYPIGVVKASTNAATAQEFVDFVQSAAGQARLKDAGFLAP